MILQKFRYGNCVLDVTFHSHIQRLQAGEWSINLGFVLSDVLNNFERISDHCSNVAVAVIELERHSFDTHQYLRELKVLDADYSRMRREYSEKYRLV